MDANAFLLAYPNAKKRFQVLIEEDAPELSSPIAKIDDRDIRFQMEERSHRVRGLSVKTPEHQLKVNILLKIDNLSYMDTLDLYSAR